MHVLGRLAIVASTVQIMCGVSWPSSLQAEQACDSVANTISSATDLILWIFVGFTLLISAFVAFKRICVYQSLFQSFSCSFNDLDGVGLPPPCSQLLLFALHLLLKL